MQAERVLLNNGPRHAMYVVDGTDFPDPSPKRNLSVDRYF